MFGYVTADLGRLNDEQRRRYKAYYCGLCRSLSERHGELARFTLTYDMTFLVMLLSGLYEPFDEHGKAPCPAHPLSEREFLQSEISDYAADMNVALAYLNCMDDWHDDLNAAALASAKVLKPAYEKVSREYPRQCSVIARSMDELKTIEDSWDKSTDAAASAFGRLMAELFVMREDHWQSDLRTFGMALGQFVYVMDACIDLKYDKRYYKYNPFVYLYGRLDEQERFRGILELLLADCVRSFDRLPIVQDADILKNILCSGVWMKFDRHYGISSK